VSGRGGGTGRLAVTSVVRVRSDDVESGRRPVAVSGLTGLVLLDGDLLEDRVLRVPLDERLIRVEGDGCLVGA
jgi:hypothetical protein